MDVSIRSALILSTVVSAGINSGAFFAASPRGSEISAASLARHTQTVLQGAFVLSKAADDAAVAFEAIDHLRRYLECVLGRTSPVPTDREVSNVE